LWPANSSSFMSVSSRCRRVAFPRMSAASTSSRYVPSRCWRVSPAPGEPEAVEAGCIGMVPLIGLAITLVILRITGQSWKTVRASDPGETLAQEH
jgi:hypothetical protein